jgi:hypothetical protein
MLSTPDDRKFIDLGFEGIKEELGDEILGPSDRRTVRVHLIAADIIGGVNRAFPSGSHSDDDHGTSSSSVASSVTDDMWVTKSQKQGKAVVQPHTGHLHDLNWEVIVVRGDRVNAYSYYDKIIIYTGGLDIFTTDAEIATIIAHEVGFSYSIEMEHEQIMRCSCRFQVAC